MKKRIVPILFALFAASLVAQNADLRGLTTVVAKLEGTTQVVGRQYAVLIAIDRYQHWMALKNPVKDAKAIKGILARRYYVSDFVELYDGDATKAGIIKLFGRMIDEAKPEDSVLIFFAGHGHLDATTNTGFWIPVDGGTDVYTQANWLPNAQVRGFIGNLKARHVVLISDSCFSGDFLNPTRGIAPKIDSEYFKNAYARVSRQVLTSGASESVPDESPFARQLKLALEGNTSPYLDPLMLYDQVRLGVTQSTPLFGDLKDSGHQQGASFLLFLQQNAALAGAQAPPPASEAPTVKLTVDKTYGSVRVATGSAGDLYLDGELLGPLPEGGAATLENIEVGPHELEMRYDNGSRESDAVVVKKDALVSAVFLLRVSHLSEQQSSGLEKAPAEQPAASSTQNAPADVLADGEAIPTASIKVDGKFDDWLNVRPAFSNPNTDKGNLGIRRAFIAKDQKNLYLLVEIADDTPVRFLHPHNFNFTHDTTYGLYIGDDTFNLNLNVTYGTWNNAWFAAIGGGLTSEPWKPISESGRYSMKGSQLEASFPLSVFPKYFMLGGSYSTSFYTCYHEGDQLVTGDGTDGKRFQY